MSKSRSVLVPLSAGLLLMVASCKNRPPSVPTVPSGPAICARATSYTFSTSSIDPQGENVAVRFSWGDKDTSDWSPWSPSGVVTGLTHAWSDTGTYDVTAQARDQKLNASDWSGAFPVRVVPSAPAVPTGPGYCFQDTTYTFKTVMTDSYFDSVSIRFYWGSGDTSAWSSYVPIGESVAMHHAWSTAGLYNVAAQARDRKLNSSGWSAALSVQVQPHTPWVWRFQIKAGVTSSNVSSPAIAPDGTIYVGSQDDNLYAVNDSGTLKWTFPTGGPVRSSPAIAADGTIYVGSFDHNLYAINPNGTLKWSYTTGGDIPSSPAIAADGTIIFGSKDGGIYALDTAGSKKWAYPGGDSIYSSPAIGPDGTVYVGCCDKYLYAVTPGGALKWRYLSGGHVHSSPAVASDGTIYFGSLDSNLYALDTAGNRKWYVPTNGQVQSSPAIGPDGTIYVGSTDDLLYAVDTTGAVKWRYVTGGNVYSSPAVSLDGTVYFGSDDDSFYALSSEGTPVWTYLTGNHIESPPTIGPDGTVYFVGFDGYLYAFKGTSSLAGSSWPKFRHDIKNTARIGGGRLRSSR